MRALPYIEPLEVPPLELDSVKLAQLMQHGGILDGEPQVNLEGKIQIGDLIFSPKSYVFQGIRIRAAEQNFTAPPVFYTLLDYRGHAYLKRVLAHDLLRNFGEIYEFGQLPGCELLEKLKKDANRKALYRERNGTTVHPDY